ncbi:MAG: hypothetical protein V3V99_08715 [candidate division Zixibacteria bacterium]
MRYMIAVIIWCALIFTAATSLADDVVYLVKYVFKDGAPPLVGCAK